jgi:hypothetical protein
MCRILYSCDVSWRPKCEDKLHRFEALARDGLPDTNLANATRTRFEMREVAITIERSAGMEPMQEMADKKVLSFSNVFVGVVERKASDSGAEPTGIVDFAQICGDD